MLAVDETALVCDMAETYGIYDIYSLPVKTVATLAAGLRPFSRIWGKMHGIDVPLDAFLQTAIFDHIRLLWWSRTTDAENNKNRPESLTDVLLARVEESEVQTFSSGKDFKEQWNKLTGGGQDGN